MDQVIAALHLLKKYHFWILVAVVLLTGAALWFKASSDLTAEYASRNTKLSSARSAVLQISSDPNPANEAVKQAVDQANQALQGNVLEAWRYLYLAQKKNNPWPAELGPAFINAIQALDQDAEIVKERRYEYGLFIKRHLPKLDEIIDRRRQEAIEPDKEGAPAESAAAAAPAPALAPAPINAPGGFRRTPNAGPLREGERWVGKVDWRDADQVKEQFTLPSNPSSTRIWLTQEDLWVYQALLRIIKNTNAGSVSYNNAAIKVIDHLEIGKAAAQAFQSRPVGGLGSSTGGTPGAGGTATLSGPVGPGTPAPPRGGGMLGGTRPPLRTTTLGTGPAQDAPEGDRERADLCANRYVDQNGKPLAANAPPPFAEFKMMPVHLDLVINYKKIPTLLAECANSSMPVEPRRVEITPLSGVARPTTTTRTAGFTGAVSAGGDAPYGDNYVRVDVLGIIYIFNPPDKEKLGTGNADEQLATATSPQATAPAAAKTAGLSNVASAPPSAPRSEPGNRPGPPPAGAPGPPPGGAPAPPPGGAPMPPPGGGPAPAVPPAGPPARAP